MWGGGRGIYANPRSLHGSIERRNGKIFEKNYDFKAEKALTISEKEHRISKNLKSKHIFNKNLRPIAYLKGLDN